jgi:GxxExxY protein
MTWPSAVATIVSRMSTDAPRHPIHVPRAQSLVHGDLTREIIGGFYEVYNTFGYGFLESVYSRALYLELTSRGLHVQREVPIDVYYKGQRVGKFRVDMLVEYRVVIETKASRWVVQADRDQLLNCLRSSCLEVGLLLHFGPRPRFHRRVARNT